MAKYKNLIVWQKANLLAFKVYKLTDDFPKKETPGIVSQLRRTTDISKIENLIEEVGRLLWSFQKGL